MNGTKTPIPKICHIAHEYGAFVVVDAAQAVTQIPVDVQQLECDFLAFSGHKALGPTGSGILWIKEALFNLIEPQMLGDAGADLDLHSLSYRLHQDYRRYWGGFSDVAGILGLGSSLEYVKNIGVNTIKNHNAKLLSSLVEKLKNYDFITCFSAHTDDAPIAVVSFVPTHYITAQELAQEFWENEVMVQLMEMTELPYLQQKLELKHCLRISVHFYNSLDDIHTALNVLDMIQQKK